jgi:ribulose-phosphate 3-epimerase
MQKVIPAILTDDPTELRNGLKALRNQTKWVQIDIMDGKFVPNGSINLFELGEAYQFFNLEIHLMVENPEKYFSDCKEMGAKRVIFHAEATDDIASVLDYMTQYPFQRAIALNSDTAVSIIAPYIDKLDSVLLMSVHPGLQAQSFIEHALSKILEIRKLKQDIIIGLDGGINETNIKKVFDAGADYVGVGSAIMQAEDPAAALTNLEEMI